ncbi:hypothetical protein CAPTEDRAFT_89390 [Capitella teleta]|uniref:BACK domain-containing protein n=1 Tax=Capitella teleta TaxID=283909 RepID=R7TCT4_CAPTE|nr:hypothetical protein CAPTEDRAFT_89390 [Capitella teleta]|eukprot:ELT89282.1 hypothetical protein CAPTEDRAFT_89390 [Capitella teleta]
MSGGWSHNSVPQPDCCSFNVQNDQWVILPPMSTAREWHSSIYHKDHLYVVGGRGDTNKYLDTVESLDIKSLQWSHLPCLPRPLHTSYVVFFSNNLFVLGGCNPLWNSEVNEYDFKQEKWMARSPMPEKCEGGAAVSFDDHVYVVGGRNKSCMQFNPISDSWVFLHRPLFQHYCGPSLIWNAKILICGGEHEDSIEECSPLTDNAWSTSTLKMPKKGDMSFAVRIDYHP